MDAYNVCVVEDDQEIRDGIGIYLVSQGYHVFKAANGQEGLDIISKEEIQEINNAIEQLPAKCKHVFFLAKIEGLPYLEIADMLHISVKTINYHVAYAIDSIAKKLKKDFRKK